MYRMRRRRRGSTTPCGPGSERRHDAGETAPGKARSGLDKAGKRKRRRTAARARGARQQGCTPPSSSKRGQTGQDTSQPTQHSSAPSTPPVADAHSLRRTLKRPCLTSILPSHLHRTTPTRSLHPQRQSPQASSPSHPHPSIHPSTHSHPLSTISQSPRRVSSRSVVAD